MSGKRASRVRRFEGESLVHDLRNEPTLFYNVRMVIVELIRLPIAHEIEERLLLGESAQYGNTCTSDRGEGDRTTTVRGASIASMLWYSASLALPRLYRCYF